MSFNRGIQTEPQLNIRRNILPSFDDEAWQPLPDNHITDIERNGNEISFRSNGVSERGRMQFDIPNPQQYAGQFVTLSLEQATFDGLLRIELWSQGGHLLSPNFDNGAGFRVSNQIPANVTALTVLIVAHTTHANRIWVKNLQLEVGQAPKNFEPKTLINTDNANVPNLMNARWEQGTMNWTNGNPGGNTDSTFNTRIRTAEMLPIMGGESYTLSWSSQWDTHSLWEYDANGAFISTGTASWFTGSTRTFTTHANCRFIRMIFRHNTNTTHVFPRDIERVNPRLRWNGNKTPILSPVNDIWDGRYIVGAHISINHTGENPSFTTSGIRAEVDRTTHWIDCKPNTRYRAVGRMNRQSRNFRHADGRITMDGGTTTADIAQVEWVTPPDATQMRLNYWVTHENPPTRDEVQILEDGNAHATQLTSAIQQRGYNVVRNSTEVLNGITFGVNQPRFNRGGLLIEQATVNVWSANNAQPNAWGSQNGRNIEYNEIFMNRPTRLFREVVSDDTVQSLWQVHHGAVQEALTTTLFLKRFNHRYIGIRNGRTPILNQYSVIDLDTGATRNNAHGEQIITSERLLNGWWKVIVTTATPNHNQIGITTCENMTGDNSGFRARSGRGVIVGDLIMVENRNFATSWTPNTRPREEVQIFNQTIDIIGGSIAIDVTMPRENLNRQQFLYDTTYSNSDFRDRVNFIIPAGGGFQFRFGTATYTIPFSQISHLFGQRVRFRIEWDERIRAYINNEEFINEVLVGNWVINNNSRIVLGARINNFTDYGNITVHSLVIRNRHGLIQWSSFMPQGVNEITPINMLPTNISGWTTGCWNVSDGAPNTMGGRIKPHGLISVPQGGRILMNVNSTVPVSGAQRIAFVVRVMNVDRTFSRSIGEVVGSHNSDIVVQLEPNEAFIALSIAQLDGVNIPWETWADRMNTGQIRPHMEVIR